MFLKVYVQACLIAFADDACCGVLPHKLLCEFSFRRLELQQLSGREDFFELLIVFSLDLSLALFLRVYCGGRGLYLCIRRFDIFQHIALKVACLGSYLL